MLGENSTKVFNYIKGFVGKGTVLTRETIAEATGLEGKTVGGVLLSFGKKGLIDRVNKAVDEKTVKYIVPTEACLTYDPSVESPSDQAKGKTNYGPSTMAVIKFLQSKIGSTEKFTAADIASALNLEVGSVNGTLTCLQRKAHIVRGEKKSIEMGDNTIKEVRYITVNPSLSNEVLA